MRTAFDTVTDWIGIPLFIVAITLLARADLIAVTTPEKVQRTPYQTSRQLGAIVAALALLLTLVRFAVLASG